MAANRTPTKEGAQGFALGTVIVRNAVETAERESKQAESMKDTLRRLQVLARPEHLSFRAVLEAKLEETKAEAELLGYSLTAYRAMSPKANSVSVTVSMWLKMSKALECGFTPDYDQSWAYNSRKATEQNEAKLAKVAPEGSTGTPVNPIARQGRKAASAYDKALKAIEPLSKIELCQLAAHIATLIG